MPALIRVRHMDSGEGLGDDAPDAQVHGHQRRVLPGGTLPVVAAAHDDAVSRRFGSFGKGGIADLEAELAQVRDVRPVGQDLRAGRHDVVGW